MIQKKIIVFDLHDVLFTRHYFNTLKLLFQVNNKLSLGLKMLRPYFIYNAFKMLKVTKVAEAYLFKLSDIYPYLKEHIEITIDMTNALKPMSHMFDLVKILKKHHYKIYVFSNIGSVSYHKLTKDYPDFFNLFDGIHYVQSSNDWLAKPHQDAYKLFLEKFNIDPESMIFIDNKYKNITAAQSLGIQGILFKSSKQVYHELSQIGIL